MQQLLDDPQTIPFMNGPKISLGKLKLQIDRRFIKIRNMLGTYAQEPLIIKSKCQECQTDQLSSKVQKLPLSYEPNVVNQKKNNVVGENERLKEKGRISLPWGGGAGSNKHRKQQSFDNVNDKYRRVRVSEYLTSKKQQKEDNLYLSKLIMEPLPDDSSNSKDKECMDTKQDDKIFSSLQFESQNIFKVSDRFLDDQVSPKFHISIEARNNDDSRSISEFSGNSEEQGKNSHSTLGRKIASMKKIRFTERTALPQPQRRIIVSDDCKQKIMDMVSKLVSKKRREPTDNKLRANVIRKIDQKYGQYYDNF